MPTLRPGSLILALAVVGAVVEAACTHKDPPPPPAVTDAGAEAGSASTAPDAGREAGPEDAGTVAPPRSLAGKKVLHVGDSMVGGTFGLTRALEAKLAPEGAKIIRSTKVSESLSSFDRTPTLRDLLRTHEPDIVIVTLGANDALSPYPEGYGQSIERIVKRIGERECWWIGPPSIKVPPPAKDAAPRAGESPSVAISAVIREHAGKCRFFDSSKLDLDRASDGLHPNDRGASKWADLFWTEFQKP